MSAIKVEDISKRYSLGSAGGYRRLTESISDAVRKRADRAQSSDFWALHHVSFEVAEGEVVGIIGRNGAGKSTLLKILSRITEPTSGRAVLRGRLGALLEVGTGFHPELTGRDNVFLNGAVLGMRRTEIQRRFDEIVAFAEVERFLDTPVKRYSSGMYVRLAFAVAAHLEPDILVVDEVLAVGDAEFQRKCLGKMGEVARGGRTVLFVSHNMAAVSGMCSRVVVLDHGSVLYQGDVRSGVAKYFDLQAEAEQTSLAVRTDRTGSGRGRLLDITVASTDGGPITCESGLRLEIGYESSADPRSLVFAVGVFDESGTEIYMVDSEAIGGVGGLPAAGRVEVRTGPLNLTAGPCFLNVALVSGGLLEGGELLDRVERAARFDVEGSDFFGTGRMRPRDWSLGLLRSSWAVLPTDLLEDESS